ncbi:MAG: hypothetical protein II712_04555 [Erysipelotrichaceae bacterium]|nr:hypothetical protein [Erysipelotrichaceae bacterium]
MKTDKQKSALSYVLLALSVIALIFACYRLNSSFMQFGRDYQRLAKTDTSNGFNDTITYNDGMLIALGYGREIEAGDPDVEKEMIRFLKDATERTRMFSFAALGIYAMFISALSLLFIYESTRENKKKQIIITASVSFLVFVLLVDTVYVSMFFAKLTAYFPKHEEFLAVMATACAVIGGNCAFMALMRNIRFHRTLALVLIPFLAVTYLLCGAVENSLFVEPEVESFDYVYEIAGDDVEAMYYDDQKNVMVYDGREYEPQMVPNLDALQQPLKTAAIAHEIINPYSGIFINLARFNTSRDISLPEHLYILKALCWMIIPLFLSGKKKRAGA